MNQPKLNSVRIRNFKAVQDSKKVKFTPLTVLIGDNGSGKSSLIEGLETLQTIVVDGLDKAMYRWRGLEHIRHHEAHQSKRRRQAKNFDDHVEPRLYRTDPLSFELQTTFANASMKVNESEEGNELFIQYEKIHRRQQMNLERDAYGLIKVNVALQNGRRDIGMNKLPREGSTDSLRLQDGVSLLKYADHLASFIETWQLVLLNPQTMGDPIPQKRTGGPIRLNKDGSNIAEYLLSIRKLDLSAFEGIIETLQVVLPYARDLQPALTSELERNVYLQLTEGKYKVPGWLLSTGTLRILALLAMLRHPTPPPLIVIEEIENGLDPSTIHLMVEEMRSAVESGLTQIILTTHSPYLLDLLPLSSIVLVERIDGQPTFTRPANQESLQEWTKSFAPGQLYTMGQLSSSQGAK
jgi:predicted ATPase